MNNSFSLLAVYVYDHCRLWIDCTSAQVYDGLSCSLLNQYLFSITMTISDTLLIELSKLKDG